MTGASAQGKRRVSADVIADQGDQTGQRQHDKTTGAAQPAHEPVAPSSKRSATSSTINASRATTIASPRYCITKRPFHWVRHYPQGPSAQPAPSWDAGHEPAFLFERRATSIIWAQPFHPVGGGIILRSPSTHRDSHALRPRAGAGPVHAGDPVCRRLYCRLYRCHCRWRRAVDHTGPADRRPTTSSRAGHEQAVRHLRLGDRQLHLLPATPVRTSRMEACADRYGNRCGRRRTAGAIHAGKLAQSAAAAGSVRLRHLPAVQQSAGEGCW